MTQQEASALIAEKVRAAEQLIRECESIADKSGVGFSLSIAYGMGGWYNPDPSLREKVEVAEGEEGEEDWEESWEESADYGWMASSQSC